MREIFEDLSWQNLLAAAKTTSRASYAIIAILLGLLACAVVLAVFGWSSASQVDVPVIGYVAMAIGVLFSLLVGIGLMALVFYSSRAGYDEPPRLTSFDGGRSEGRHGE
jgi:hypothetical protein